MLFLNIYHKYMESSKNYEQYKASLKIVISQTGYDEKEASEKLKKWDNDFIKVIKEYLNPDFQIKKKEKKKSLNQSVISEIRKFKDKQCLGYIKEKNNEYEINKLLYLNSLKNYAPDGTEGTEVTEVTKVTEVTEGTEGIEGTEGKCDDKINIDI